MAIKNSFIFLLIGLSNLGVLYGEKNISVLIVGGGVAGLTAAVQLTNIPGIKVHVTHESDQMGDDIGDVELKLNSTTYKLSKVHPDFSSSSNATLTLMDYLKLRPNLKLEDAVTLEFAAYNSHTVSYKDSLFSIINYARSSQSCYSIFSLPAVILRMRRINNFKYNQEIKKLENINFSKYLKSLGIVSPEYDCLLAPSLSTTGYNATIISAYEAMTRIWSNLLDGGNHDALRNYQYIRNSSKSQSVMQAIRNKLEKAGVTFQTNYTIKSFFADGINNKILADNADKSKKYDFVILASGPAVTIPLLTKTAEMYSGELTFANLLINIANQLKYMRNCPTRKVMKVIFNKKIDSKRAGRVVVSGYKYLQSVVILDRYHSTLDKLAMSVNGSVLELQMTNLPYDSVPWTEVYKEVVKVLPELSGAKILNKTESFLAPSRSLEVDEEQHRLLVDSAQTKGIQNLLFANDWLATPGYAAVDLEKPIYLGLQAAYKILSHTIR